MTTEDLIENDADWSLTDKPSSVFKDTASKSDQGKTMLAYIPGEALVQMGRVMTHGADKYGAFNYTKGHKSTQLISAALRHIIGDVGNPGYLMGNDTDKDSGLLHLAHAMANLAMLIQQTKDGTIDDDRPNLHEVK